MANEQRAFLPSDQLPSRGNLQKVLDELDVGLRLGDEFDLATAEGFEPCSLREHETGVEVYVERDASEWGDLVSVSPEAKACIVFCWVSSMAEMSCAMLLSYALTVTSGAAVSYEGEPTEPRDSLRDAATNSVTDSLKELERVKRRRG